MWTRLIALAVTIPLTITIASAQASKDADIAAYSQDLAMRIARGRQSGQLTQANYNSVQSLYNNVEMIRRGLGNRAMNPMVRMNMMNSLTNLDKQLTRFLHDDVNSRYQMWDPTRRAWRNNWWQADTSGANNFNSEIDAYQNSLKERIDRGRQAGRITRAEMAQLTTSYHNVDRAQQQYRIGGFSSWERNSLMSMLTQLDKDITAQMHDDENSHYRNWNANSRGWNNSWWKNADTNASQRDGHPGDWKSCGDSNNRDWSRGDSNRGDSSNRNWNRGDGIRSNSNTREWNGGGSNRGGWNNRAGFGESNESINRSSNPSGGAQSGTISGGSSTAGGSTTKIYTPPPSTGNAAATTKNPPPVSPPLTTPPTSATPPAATNNPPAVTGSPSTGTTSGEGRRGNWSGDGRGERTGEGRGDRSGSGTGERSRESWERRQHN
ncbi:MAG: hypothetical protein IT342_23915 [Candidatus Melainabacteria bacterium]|nr:hypothetical protein [Candidatus Melainabacteria bacterium]